MRTILELGRRRIDLDSGEVEGIGTLRPMERALLRFLAENLDRPVSIHEMHTEVWGYAPSANSRTAYTTLGRLRPLLEDDPKHPQVLVAERGDGYRLRNARVLTIAVDGPATNLRPRTDTFFGRASELEDLRGGSPGALTVVGAAGVGKTRVIVEAASGVAVSGGVWFCELEGALSRDDLVRHIARSLPGTTPADLGAVGAALADRGPCWVVLDGAERLAQAVAEVSTFLVHRAPAARVFVTRRRPLGTPEERVVEVLPLARPASVALLRDRVEKRSRRWALEADAADRLCERVGDLPLAVEIVAASVALLGPDVVLEQLRRGGSLGPSLDTVVSSTLEPVDPASMQLLAMLAVLDGPVRLDAAEATLGIDDAVEAFARLADLSVLAVIPSPGGPRFGLLPIVRSFVRRTWPVPEEPVLARLLSFAVARSEAGETALPLEVVRQLAQWLRPRPDATLRRLVALVRAAHATGDAALAAVLADQALDLGVGVDGPSEADIAAWRTRYRADPGADGILEQALVLLDPRRRVGASEPAPLMIRSLPAERDRFVGRESELADLGRRHDAGARLVSLLGPGGSGKTRLAIRHALGRRERWPGGVWFCDLSEARSLDGVFHAVARGLSVPAGSDPAESLGRAIASRGQCIVILDNFEQVAEHAEATVGRWLDAAADASFLVTSRERLGLAGEQGVVLAPLTEDDARALFLLRAETARPGFVPADPATIDALLRLLDDLPLAIELAAARLRTLSVDDILARMTDRFRLLTAAGRRTDRQATLRATLDGSWELLCEAQKDTLAALSVFEGGFDLAAAEAVVDLPGSWAFDEVQGLVDRSLVQCDSAGRFQLLLSVQEYAREHLVAQGREDAACVRHGEHFARKCKDDRDVELSNFVIACRRACARGAADVAVKTLGNVMVAIDRAGPYTLGLSLADDVLALELTSLQRARVRAIAGALELSVGRLDAGEAHLDAAVDLLDGCGNPVAEGRTLVRRAIARSMQGRRDEAETDLRLALQKVDPGYDESVVLSNLGSLLVESDPEESGRLLEAGLSLQRRLGDRVGESFSLDNLGLLARGRGDLAEAERCHRDALALAREVGHRRSEAGDLLNLGDVLHRRGRYDAARASLLRAIDVYRALGNRGGMATTLIGLAELAVDLDDPGEARAWLAEALTIHRELGNVRAEADVLERIRVLQAASCDEV